MSNPLTTIRDLIIEKVNHHIEWGRYDEAQELINTTRKLLIFNKTVNDLQEKLESEMNLRNQFLRAV